MAIVLLALVATFSFDRKAETGTDIPGFAAESVRYEWLDGEKVPVVTVDGEDFYYAANKSYFYDRRRDTITGTTRDTIKFPWIMASPYQYEAYVRLRKLSGTPNTKILLQSRTITNGIWSPIDSVSAAGADSTKVHFRLRGALSYGTQYQLIFVRTGSHSLERDVEIAIKPPNQ